MDLTAYLTEAHITQSEFAALLGVSQALVGQWARGIAVPPPVRCVEIELATDGRVSRVDLRPDDWAQIWPELLWLRAWQEWGLAQPSWRAAVRGFVRYGARWLFARRP